MEINKKIERYLNERRPNQSDYNIKDVALALTGEIEVSIENIVNSLWDDKIGILPTSDVAKIINLAIKNINKNKVVKNCLS